MTKKQIIVVGVASFLFFCIFLFYTRIEMQRLISVRVQSALELNKAAHDYLKLVRRARMNVKNEGDALIYESFGN